MNFWYALTVCLSGHQALAITWFGIPRKPPPPPHESDTFVIPPFAPPPKLPESPNSSPRVQYSQSCGLYAPNKKAWDEGDGEKFSKWIKPYHGAFVRTPGYSSFPLYMRDAFAPDVTPSSLRCDGLGTCTLATCLSISRSLPQHDRQMAYYFFESLSGIDHHYAVTDKALARSTSYYLGKMRAMVERYTSAPAMEKALIERRKAQGTRHYLCSYCRCASGCYGSFGCGRNSCSSYTGSGGSWGGCSIASSRIRHSCWV
ncbi:hypothetical protein CC80DRAFT_64717 [Byssothecium circinans]|uniref:Uncharacterized protein n=1 Tax=Byssothecium circinans TaxID=147558 RepID=A0A6A5TUZ8_9PLEO|nr:hypothetical protein CC80DRAFT_64717 [Byssothecium circinans]